MPWRLIVFIAIFAVFMVFVVFNLENRCDISFGFAKFDQVPVFITIFVSFIFGFFCALPLIVHFMKKKKGSIEKDYNPKKDKNFKKDVKPKIENIIPSGGGVHAV